MLDNQLTLDVSPYSSLYDIVDGQYNLVPGRRYEVIINMGMHSTKPRLITLRLLGIGVGILKSTPATSIEDGFFSMSLSCIVDGDIPIRVSIKKEADVTLTLYPNQCWFAVHEIK